MNSNLRSVMAVTALLIAVVAYRTFTTLWLPDFPNFAPLMAVAFCGGLLLGFRMGLLLATLPLILSDAAVNLHYGLTVFGGGEAMRLLCYLAAFALGRWLQKRKAGLLGIASAVFANAVLFYLVTNTGSWLGNPAYSQTWAGWLQSLTVGLPGFPPTFVFFRNSLLGDFAFTAFVLGCWSLAGGREPLPVRSTAGKP
jgi:hypothetical protein